MSNHNSNNKQEEKEVTITLNFNNWFTWDCYIKDKSPLYGDAGAELRTGKPVVYEEPMKTELFS